MFYVGVEAGGRFLLTLDHNNAYYNRVDVLIRSLLSAYQVERHQWSLNYDDLLYLQVKLKQFGLVDQGATMSAEANAWFQQKEARVNQGKLLKQGAWDHTIEEKIKGRLKATLFPDQLTGVAYLYYNYRAGMLDSMGAGKSLEALAAVVALEDVEKTLIVCPKGVIPGFTSEVLKHTYMKPLSVPASRAKALSFLKKNKDKPWDVLLIHPENLVGTTKEPRSPILEMVRSMPWDMIIIDEFHMYKNEEAKRTQAIMTLVQDSRTRAGQLPRCIPMTGTLISEAPLNARTFLAIIDYGDVPHPIRFENYFTTKKTLKKKITNKYGHQIEVSYPKIVGHKNLKLLKQMIERRSIRRTKADLKGFPARQPLVRDVFLSGKQAVLYKALKGELATELQKDTRQNIMQILAGNATAIRMRQLLNHPSIVGEKGESAKHLELDALLEELFSDPTQKAIVWTEYRAAVDLLYERYHQRYGVMKVYGGVDITDKLIEQFESDGRPRIAAAIPAKGGTGLDFLARARTAFYLDRPYSLVLFSQSLERIHRRVGENDNSRLANIRRQPATLVFLDASGTIDEFIRSRLEYKVDVAEAVSTSDEVLIRSGKKDLLKYLR